jgi:hypothetical protein
MKIRFHSFGKGKGWMFTIGRLYIHHLPRSCASFLKPWGGGRCVYWLRFAIELLP